MEALLRETLLCPVCLEMIFPPTVSCVNGHLICTQCFAETKEETCCICRVAMPDQIRALAFEKVVDLSSLRFQCLFHPLCQKELTYSQRTNHVGACAHGYSKCTYVGCGKNILLTDMQLHTAECEHAPLRCHLCGNIVSPLHLATHLQTYHEAVMFHCPNMARLVTPRVFAFPAHVVDWDDITTNVETIVVFTMPSGVMQSLTVAVRIMVTDGRKEAQLQPFVVYMTTGKHSYDDVYMDVLCASECSLVLLNPHDASRPFEVCDGIGHSICGKPPRYPVMRASPPFSRLTVALTEEDCSAAQIFVKVSLGFH